MFEFLHKIFSSPSALHLMMALLGGFIVLFGLVSLFVKERLYLTESLVATLVGIAFGPFGLRVVMPAAWFPEQYHTVILEFSRVVIAMQVMAVGVSTPGGYLKKHWPSVLVLLGPVMVLMYLISTVAVKLVLRFDWYESMIIGACVSPTDPVLAHSVIKGKFASRYIPYHLRHLLAVESAANDGLGFPLLMLPLWLMIAKTTASALGYWTVHTLLYEIGFSMIVGFLCGRAARFLLRQSEKRKLIDKDSFLVFTIALTLLITGVVALLASDDLLAVFIAGNVFAWDQKFVEATEDSHISEVIDMLFNITYFVFFGAIIPWAAFREIGILRLVALAAAILLFRRLPAVMLLKPTMSALYSRKEAFFCGWFGPMGVGAVFFSMMARNSLLEHMPTDAHANAVAEDTFTIVAFLVLSSILIHGITVPITNFHMKKRAKRKVKRSAKIQRQMEEIASNIEDLTPSQQQTVQACIAAVEAKADDKPHGEYPDNSSDDWDSEDEYINPPPAEDSESPVDIIVDPKADVRGPSQPA